MWNAIDRSVKALNLKEVVADHPLKYTRYKNLSLFNIRYIDAE